MTDALATLFYVFENGAVDYPAPKTRTLFIGARAHPSLKHFENLTCQQYFKPYADGLSYPLADAKTLEHSAYDLALVLPEKNKIAAHYQIALATQSLKPGGMLVCAAANDAGGKSLPKLLKDLGANTYVDEVKNKARAVWTSRNSIDQQRIEAALIAGKMQNVEKTGFTAQPGMFGWDKIDQGSALLIETLPDRLFGIGADFGCGYGYLSRHVLENYPNVEKLYGIDTDSRALEAYAMNTDQARSQTLWADLTQSLTALPPLDFIVMNPPFHEGKKTDSDIGTAFIKTAASAIKKGGHLYMVANSHLPYEKTLLKCFDKMSHISNKFGFKVLAASK